MTSRDLNPMNIDDGIIHQLPADITEREALLRRLVPIEMAIATEKQQSELRVSLNDHRSELGKLLTAARSKYIPHVGAKQAAKAASPI